MYQLPLLTVLRVPAACGDQVIGQAFPLRRTIGPAPVGEEASTTAGGAVSSTWFWGANMVKAA